MFAYAWGLYFVAAYIDFTSSAIFYFTVYAILALTAYLIYKIDGSMGLAIDFCVVMPFIWWISPGIGSRTALLVFLPLFTGVWLTASFKLPPRFVLPVVWIGPLL